MKNYIFVPIGSYEHHGPHLPPDTDYLIAKKLVQVVSPIFEGNIIEGIKISVSNEHEGFKDTKSISQENFKYQIDKLISRFQNNSYFILINAHGGNNTILKSIQELYTNKILVLNTFSLIKKDLINIRTSEIGGICHAGEFETSIMLYLYPELVKMNNLKIKDVKYVPHLDPNYENEKLKDWKTTDYNKKGVLGDPFYATPEKGKLWFTALIEKIKSLTEKFIN